MARVKIVTRKELCELMDIKLPTMRKNISRNLLAESSPGEINVFNIKNQKWIVDYCDKKGINYEPIFKKAPLKKNPTVQSIVVDEVLNDDKKEVVKEPKLLSKEAIEHQDNIRKKLQEEVKKVKLENEIKKTDLQKKRGRIVPIDFMIEVIGGYIKSNIGGIVNDGNSLLDRVIDELGGTYEMKLKYKKEFKSMVNGTFKNNHESLTDDICEKAKSYAVDTKW